MIATIFIFDHYLMRFELITESPLWWLIFCVLTGLLYAYILYRKRGADRFTIPTRRVLFTLRAITVSFLAFLLLTPLIKLITRETEKPLLIFAQDNSSSIVFNKDSSFYKQQYPEQISGMLNELRDKYEVIPLSFGNTVEEGLPYTFSDKQTDFSALFAELAIRYGNRNVGAVVLASDGLYNRGTNPIFETEKLNVPVYSLALGDTNVKKDLLIARVNYNKKVFLGNAFPLEIRVNARQSSGAQTTLSVRQGEKVLFSRQLNITSNAFSLIVPVILEADKKGIQQYTIEVDALEGEATLINNKTDIYIEVLERKQKILLLTAAPHPDIAAMREAIETNQNYEVVLTDADNIPASIKEYHLVLLHNLPNKQNGLAEFYKKAMSEELPLLFVLGQQTDFNQLNSWKSLLNISVSLNKGNPAAASVNSGFSLFNLTDETQRIVSRFPPLLTPFGKYTFTRDHYILLYQQIGNVRTDNPLIAFSGSGEPKTGVICGEGIWRWRMTDYRENGNFNAFNEIILKSIQNLAVRETKSRFRIFAQTSFAENEAVQMDAEVFNSNFELINVPDVNITISGKEGYNYPFSFSRSGKAYHLNAGFLPPGNYSYKASVNAGDQVFSKEGVFSVSPLQIEQSETVADHQLLYNLAKKQGGDLFGIQQLKELAQALNERKDIKSVIYSHSRLQDLLNEKAVFFLLLLLLSLEWFLRKRAGSY